MKKLLFTAVAMTLALSLSGCSTSSFQIKSFKYEEYTPYNDLTKMSEEELLNTGIKVLNDIKNDNLSYVGLINNSYRIMSFKNQGYMEASYYDDSDNSEGYEYYFNQTKSSSLYSVFYRSINDEKANDEYVYGSLKRYDGVRMVDEAINAFLDKEIKGEAIKQNAKVNSNSLSLYDDNNLITINIYKDSLTVNTRANFKYNKVEIYYGSEDMYEDNIEETLNHARNIFNKAKGFEKINDFDFPFSTKIYNEGKELIYKRNDKPKNIVLEDEQVKGRLTTHIGYEANGLFRYYNDNYLYLSFNILGNGLNSSFMINILPNNYKIEEYNDEFNIISFNINEASKNIAYRFVNSFNLKGSALVNKEHNYIDFNTLKLEGSFTIGVSFNNVKFNIETKENLIIATAPKQEVIDKFGNKITIISDLKYENY